MATVSLTTSLTTSFTRLIRVGRVVFGITRIRDERMGGVDWRSRDKNDKDSCHVTKTTRYNIFHVICLDASPALAINICLHSFQMLRLWSPPSVHVYMFFKVIVMMSGSAFCPPSISEHLDRAGSESIIRSKQSKQFGIGDILTQGEQQWRRVWVQQFETRCYCS